MPISITNPLSVAGYGFITFTRREEADAAISALHLKVPMPKVRLPTNTLFFPLYSVLTLLDALYYLSHS